MNDEKLISIVLPVYNGAEHMAGSIERVLRQTWKNWELIIVNDCSTDQTLAVAESYQKKDSRIRVLSNSKNLKLPLTLNAGFAQAKGEYYTWTSDDNLYQPEALSSLVQALEQDHGCVMVYSDFTDIDTDGNEIGRQSLSEPERIVCGNVCGACFLYRAEAAKEAGQYDANLFLAEDYDYWMRLYRVGTLRHIHENLYLYRRHAGSLSATRRADINLQTYKAIEKNFLPLYTDAKKHGLEYAMFDQMVFRAGEDRKEDTLRMLCAVNPGYKVYLQRKAMGAGFRASAVGKALKSVKGIMNR